jgi:dTDP-4-dehydrorhamnose 3,5-epimerase-like enzyme
MPRYGAILEPSPLTSADLLEDAARDLTRQSYAPRPAIAGVVLGEMPVFRSPDGLFAEVIRLDGDHQVQGLPGFRPIQWNWSVLEPGAVKAWHVHLGQDDLWIIPPDTALLVGLVDLRKGSPTASALQRLSLGAGRCHRLLIPRGVGHGVANLATRPQAMLYAVNRLFSGDPAATDEWRLPWDRFGDGFWAMGTG